MSSQHRGHQAPPGASAPCFVCGSRRRVPHFSGGRAARTSTSAAAPYRITRSERGLVGALARCAECGVVWLPAELAAVTSYGEAADPYYLEQAADRIANAHRLLDLVAAGGRLLEIGCACGFLLLAARERGFAAQGVELSAWAVEQARSVYGLAVHHGAIDSAGFSTSSFDVTVLADVIEHLTDPRSTVREIRRVLRPGGTLLVLTPDIGSLAARFMGRRWWGLLDDHYQYFSRATLRRFLESEGFAVERVVAFGRRFPLRHWVYKMGVYGEALPVRLLGLLRALRLDGLSVSINLGDQMACVARAR